MSGPGKTKRPVNFYFTFKEVKVLEAEAKDRKSNKTNVMRSLVAGLAAGRAALGLSDFGVGKDAEPAKVTKGRKVKAKTKRKAAPKRAKRVAKARRKRRTKAEMEAARALVHTPVAPQPAPIPMTAAVAAQRDITPADMPHNAVPEPVVEAPEGPADIELVVADDYLITPPIAG